MVVNPELPKLDVSVHVEDVALKEWVDPDLDEDNRTVTRYIEAVANKRFDVRLVVSEGFQFEGDLISCEVYIDGKRMDHPIIRKKEGEPRQTRISKGVAISANEVKYYQFSAMKTIDEGMSLQDDASIVKDIGTIEVRVCHGKDGGRIAPQDVWYAVPSWATLVSEKALKGKSMDHNVSYSAPEKGRQRAVFRVEDVKGLPNPFAIYKFLYRSTDALKSMLIIPRTPTPPPLEERDPDTLTRDDLVELQKRAKAVKKEASTTRIKRESERDENPRQRKIAKPRASNVQLEIDDDGSVREISTPAIEEEEEVIELD